MSNLFDKNFKKEIIEGLNNQIAEKKERIKRIEEGVLESRKKLGNVWAKKEFYEFMALKNPVEYGDEKSNTVAEFSNLQSITLRTNAECEKSIAKLMNEIEVLEDIKASYEKN